MHTLLFLEPGHFHAALLLKSVSARIVRLAVVGALAALLAHASGGAGAEQSASEGTLTPE